MQKIIFVIMCCMLLSIINSGDIQAFTKKDKLESLISKDSLDSMKNKKFYYQDLSINLENNKIKEKFGEPNNIYKYKYYKVYLYKTNAGNRFKFYTSIDSTTKKKYERLKSIIIIPKNKNILLSNIKSKIGSPGYSVTEGHNQINYYNQWLSISSINIDGDQYVSQIQYGSLNSMPE